jgi:hypothetical protein
VTHCHSAWGSGLFGVTAGNWESLTVVTRLIEPATHPFVEPEFTQLVALFAAWRDDIDSEPFAHESDWATVDSPAFRVVSTWASQRHGPQPGACPGGTPSLP